MHLEEESKAADDQVQAPDDIEQDPTEASVVAPSSSEMPPHHEITAPVPTTASKKQCSSLARYVAGFWLVRTALGLTDSALCLIEILAQTLGTPLLEPLNLFRRAIRFVLDEPVESLTVTDKPLENLTVLDEQLENLAVLDEQLENLAVMDEPLENLAVVDEPVKSLADAQVSSNTDGPIASNHSPNEDENHSVDTNEDTKNPVDVIDEPILKTEIRESVESMIKTKLNMSIEGTEFKENNDCGAKRNSSDREAGIYEDGLKITEVEGFKDFVEASTNHKNMEEFEEEVLRKMFTQAVQDVEPIKLKTYEKRKDDIVEVEGINIFNNLEECDIEAIDIMDGFKTEDDTSDEISYGKALALDEPSTQSSFSQDQYYPPLLEQTFLGPPAPTPTSTRRFPGFRHLFVYEPYQTRYGSLGQVEDLVDDLIFGAVQISSSGANSTRDEPADYPLPDDSFDSSFESNEF